MLINSLLVRLPINSMLLAVKFLGSHELYAGFQLCEGFMFLTTMSFKCLLYHKRKHHFA